MNLTVGTRGSKLSLMQTEQVIATLKNAYPKINFKIKVIRTLGDSENSLPLFSIDSRGIFEKEIDQEIVNGTIDFAVASLKDVPTGDQSGVIIAAIPKRASPNDVLISRKNVLFSSLKEGARIGTGSLRRLSQIKFLRPDLEVVPIRGNLDTRIRKVKSGVVDGIIVAKSGLERIGLVNVMTECLSLDNFTPAPGQGALALIARQDNLELIRLLHVIDDYYSRAEVTAERVLMQTLGGGCRVPIGAIGRIANDCLSLKAVMYSLEGANKISSFNTGKLCDSEKLGKGIAHELIKKGAEKIKAEWREKYGAW